MLAKCAFCGKEHEDYLGTYYIKNDGSTLYFSSSKCMKSHLKLKRDRRKFKWTQAFHEQRDKRLAKAKEVEEIKKKKKAEKAVKKKSKQTTKPAK